MVASDVFGAATDRARAHAQPGLPRRARTATDFYSDMVPSSAPLHIYHRDIEADQHTSLTVVTGHIQPGDRVLDLGCGTGAIGRHLAQRDDGAVIDGLTLSAREAELAAPHYRRVEIANLDDADLTQLFDRGAYDAIVCADVLEHVHDSARVLRQCHDLLAPAGRMLLSIPNTAYAGLIAELMCGEFRYRDEGLLDATHVRFFTRRTLQRFLHQCGYAIEHLDVVERSLPASEFRAAFDALPPAVARHLLALPDALTYQFIVVARPLDTDAGTDTDTDTDVDASDTPQLPAQALFTAQLYLGHDTGYTESDKLIASGVIGAERQTLRFKLPASAATTLRLDPADRPGFLHLHAMRLHTAQGDLLWHWDSQDVHALLGARQNGIVAQPPIATGGPFLLLLHGDDPWIELPISAPQLEQARGGTLEIDAGWPMSADYLALAGAAQRQQHNREQAARQLTDAHHQLHALQADLATQQQHQQALQQQHQALGDEHQQLQDEHHELQSEHDELLDEHQELLDEHYGLLDMLQHAQHAQQERHTRQLNHTELLNGELRRHIHELLTRMQRVSVERDEAVQLLDSIQNSTVFRLTRPPVHAKMWLDRKLGRGSARATTPQPAVAVPLAPGPEPVDIILPVYRGLADTQLSVRSVLASPCQVPWRLVVINDASPEPEVTDWLRQHCRDDPRILLLENEHNLGFVGTVNRGMALSADRDVLLLNSDTEVAGHWLDRIRAAAYGDQKIASVTPFSNNATICSYPRFCQDNELPHGWSVAELDALCARTLAGQVVDVPTGVGFCMYIRRAALDAVGLFDVENFGKGYGEENDFCVRAAQAGWRNLHALDTFVFHSGGVSFGAGKTPRERAAMDTMRRLHPQYELEVMRFIERDPAAPARALLDLARLPMRQLPVILLVLHDRDGGTLRQATQLAEALADQASMLLLRPAPGQQLQLEIIGQDTPSAVLRFGLPHDFDALEQVLRTLGVDHIHYHHLLGHHPLVRDELSRRLGVTHDFTVHDFHTVCPQISMIGPSGAYCGEAGLAQCQDCLVRQPAPDHADIVGWRQNHAPLLESARHVIAPSRDALERLRHYLPHANLVLVPHLEADDGGAQPLREPTPRAADAPLRIAVLGALSVIKGADTLEDVARAARRAGAPLEFHLIGYAYRSLRTQPDTALSVHGPYQDDELPALIDAWQPDLIWFPARVPETYSYTLSAALRAGLPIVAPNLGAFPERLEARPWSWIEPWDRAAADWLDFFLRLRQRHFLPAEPPPLHHARALNPLDTPAADPRQLPARWYHQDYLHGLAPPSHLDLQPHDVLLHHLANRPAPATGQASRRGALRLLVRLRALPVLAPLARRIPPAWQRRVKNWLTH